MTNDWGYTGLKALGSGKPESTFLPQLSKQLYRFTRDVTKKHNEFPVGYTEWTLSGHMNIVAYRCGYLPCSDYCVKLSKEKTGKRAKNRAKRTHVTRPDLHVHNRDWKDSWIFEFKRKFISLTPTKRELENLGDNIVAKLQEAHSQLHKTAAGSTEWADHGCSSVACTVWMRTHVDKDLWQRRWSDHKR